MITLPKAFRDSYWWKHQGNVSIDTTSIESVEEVYATSGGGGQSFAYTLITMKSGVQHQIYGPIEDIQKRIACDS